MKNPEFLLIDSDILPDVYQRVIRAKEMVADGSAQNISEAVKAAEISRSAFYKYKDHVFRYDGTGEGKILNISAILEDRAGVFSALTAKLYENRVNILTINQSLPVDGMAAVSLSVRTDALGVPLEELIRDVQKLSGVVSVKIV